ncbi:MAG: hypothetical protein ACKOVA_03600 [Novosphingobium sp.]
MPADKRRAPGARGRIGIIQPAPGVMLEHEWPRWLPPEVLFPVGRIRMPGATSAAYAQMAAAAPEMARDLAFAGAGVIAYACTIGSLFAGAQAERDLLTALSEAAGGKPAIGLAATCASALRAVGGRRLAIMTPYSSETNGWVADYAEAEGFAVDSFLTTPVGIVEVGNIQPPEIAAFAIAAMAQRPDADALWIPCTAIQTMDAIATIEAVTGRPVISGTQALMWHALRILGVDDPIRGAGRLFETT